jgi:hypothetical protein
MHFRITAGGLLFFILFFASLKADDRTQEWPQPAAEQLKSIREQSLILLRDITPAGSSGRKMETMAIDGGEVYWGNLFDPVEVVALLVCLDQTKFVQ